MGLRPFVELTRLDGIESIHHDVEDDTLRSTLPGVTNLLVCKCDELHLPFCNHDEDDMHGIDMYAVP